MLHRLNGSRIVLRVTGEEVERFASIHGDLPISISKSIVPSGFKLTQDESFFVS